jgi:hypothetical protein
MHAKSSSPENHASALGWSAIAMPKTIRRFFAADASGRQEPWRTDLHVHIGYFAEKTADDPYAEAQQEGGALPEKRP